MSAFIESLILYAVLFFRFSTGSSLPGDIVEFSMTAEIVRIVLYNIPSLALIWYLLLKVKSSREWGIALPGKKDLVPIVLATPALFLISLTIAFISPRLGGAASLTRFLPPQTLEAWIVLVFSCITTGYLEESFFRFYLLSKREEMGLGPHRAVLFSTLLFSFCHIYEGPWGFLNAALSGTVLAIIFLRSRSLHGIAIAHALYNVLVFVTAIQPVTSP